MGLTNVLEADSGAGTITVKNTAINTALKSLATIKTQLETDQKTNITAVNAMCTNWRSEIGKSASAFFYANATLIAYSNYCINTMNRAKQTMRDYSDDMDLIDQDLEAMNFLSASDSTDEGE